jgi:hypothetical protein
LALHAALDIGGTFTDLVVFDDATGALQQAKSSTTPRDLAVGIRNCLEKSSTPLPACESFVHGSTVAINTVIERSGARTALVTTRGTRDVYRVGRANRPEAYNLFFKRPVPLVPRSLTVEVDERLLASGEARTPLTPDEAAAVARRVAAFAPEAVAVCLLHSYANPAHEIAIGRALRPDSGGAGKYRGGLGLDVRLRNRIAGRWNLVQPGGPPPRGLWGGKSGDPSNKLLRQPDDAEWQAVNASWRDVPADSQVIIRSAGGGGWGDPLERDPERVLGDVREGFVSREAAEQEYGVVLVGGEGEPLRVDAEATARARAALRAARDLHGNGAAPKEAGDAGVPAQRGRM